MFFTLVVSLINMQHLLQTTGSRVTQSDTLLALLWSNWGKAEQTWVTINWNRYRSVRWHGKSCLRGPIELTEQQNAGQTSCPWTCKRGRPAQRGPACSSPSHGYPVCRRSGVGCSPHYPHSSAMPSHCYATVRHIINTLMYSKHECERPEVIM